MKLIIDWFWIVAAKILCRPFIVRWLIKQSAKTPYKHIPSPCGDFYMKRYWLFNPYYGEDEKRKVKYPWFPWSIRLHHIKLRDEDSHLHDHSWDARTIILKNSYLELKESHQNYMAQGSTGRINFGEYHKIIWVPDDGVWTLFITGKYRGTWGFNVDGQKVEWKTYLSPERRSKESE